MLHLIVDGLGTRLPLLRDQALLCATLRDLVQMLGMAIMKGPVAVEAAGFGPQSGVTAVAIISESHIAIHTWPERSDYNLNIDIFSCLAFDYLAILQHLERVFGMRQRSYRVIERPLKGGESRVSGAI